MEFSFTIGTNEYSVPEVVTVDLFQRAICWDVEDIKNHKPFVSVMADCPIPELKLLDEETFNVVLAVCVSRLNFADTVLRQNIGGFQLIDLNNMTFGQFVDIDILIADGMTKHAVEIVKMLYGIPEKAAAEKDVRDVWQSLLMINEFRSNVYRDYDEFFELNDSKEEESITLELGDLQLMWYEAILVLAEHKFLNIQYVTERPYKEALNFLTWKKNEIAKEKLEQLKRKNDLRTSTR